MLVEAHELRVRVQFTAHSPNFLNGGDISHHSPSYPTTRPATRAATRPRPTPDSQVHLSDPSGHLQRNVAPRQLVPRPLQIRLQCRLPRRPHRLQLCLCMRFDPHLRLSYRLSYHPFLSGCSGLQRKAVGGIYLRCGLGEEEGEVIVHMRKYNMTINTHCTHCHSINEG